MPKQGPRNSSSKKKIGWGARIALIAGIVTILTFILDLPGKIANLFPPNPDTISGVIIYPDSKPVSDAEIKIYDDQLQQRLIGAGRSNSRGEFRITATEKISDGGWVIVIKDSKIGFNNYATTSEMQRIVYQAPKPPKVDVPEYDVTLILPSKMIGANIYVDNRPADIKKDNLNTVVICVKHKNRPHHIKVIKNGFQTCEKKILIREDLILTPCQ